MYSKLLKITTVVAIVLSINTAFAEEKETPQKYGPLSEIEYLIGGAVGTFIGFGLGHAVVNEYSRIGWAFTLGEITGMGLLYGGMFSFINSDDPDMSNRDLGLIIAGSGLFFIFRIWEIADIWIHPAKRLPHRNQNNYQNNTAESQNFVVIPYGWKDGGGFVAAYRF